MATFQYTARTVQGQQVTGVLQADSSSAAIRSLGEKQLFPVKVQEQADAGSAGASRKVKPRDVGVFYGQLSDLVRSGVPLLRALDTLSRAGSNKRLADVVRQTRQSVATGDALGDALAKNPEVFPALHIAMVRAGERGGFLEDVLTNLAGFIERQDELTGKIRGALIYPIVLVGVGVIVMLIALVVVVPNFQPMFKGVPLPLPSVVLFAMSDVLVEQWPLAIGGTLFIGLALVGFLRSEAGRDIWDRARFRIPIFGHALRMTCVTRFCRILGTMLANSVPILQALTIAKDAAGSRVLAAAIQDASESVRAGQTLVQPLRKGSLFPPEVLEMIAVAEESNQLEKVLVEIANTVERRTNRKIDDVVHLIEPMVLVVIAGAVLFLAVGLLYPIFTMSNHMR